MARRHVRLRVSVGVAGVAIIGFLSLATGARAQGPSARLVSIRAGVGAGYTAAPNYPGESLGGDWNGEAFVILGLRGIPVELRPTVFTYGRGTDGTLFVACPPCAFPGCKSCPSYYASGSGRERATGGSLDATVRLARGPFVPYLVGGLGAVGVSRQTAPAITVHSTGLGYEYGAGAQLTVGRLIVFGEGKFFGTRASAEQFADHSVHMLPLTIGIAF